MMRILYISLVFIFFSHSMAHAGNKAEIPTSIQIYDAQGNTDTTTPISATLTTRIRSVVIPVECSPFFKKTPKADPSVIPDNPLRTRIESQLETLKREVQKIHFTPYLPKETEQQLQQALIDFSLQTLTYPINSEKNPPVSPYTCMELLSREIAVYENNPVLRDFSVLEEIHNGLIYAQTLSHATDTVPLPHSLIEAQYFGDILTLRDPFIKSLGFTEKNTSLVYQRKTSLLGYLPISYDVHIAVRGTSTEVQTPWWIFLSSAPPVELQYFRVATSTFSGHAQYIKEILPLLKEI